MGRRIVNPYLTQARTYRFHSGWRLDLVTRYSWAIPNEKALNTLARFSPLIEIGAGTGYWAMLLRSMGVDILAFDTQPPNSVKHGNRYFTYKHRNGLGTEVTAKGTTWTKVERGGTGQVRKYPDRTLFLCWPPHNSKLAFNALNNYRGERFIFVGEYDDMSCTGDEAFRQLLQDQWETEAQINIPRWPGMHDDMTIWRRKAAQVIAQPQQKAVYGLAA